MRHFEKSRDFFDFSIAKLLHFGNLFGIVIVACGSDSVVECHLAKVKVAGPNPVSRSKVLARAFTQTCQPLPFGGGETQECMRC